MAGTTMMMVIDSWQWWALWSCCSVVEAYVHDCDGHGVGDYVDAHDKDIAGNGHNGEHDCVRGADGNNEMMMIMVVDIIILTSPR